MKGPGKTKARALPDLKEAIAIMKKAGANDEVIKHCQCVATLAVTISKRLQKRGVKIDGDLVLAGALLHDIGRSKSHEIDHAVVGAAIAKDMGLDERIVRIIERHIGAGIPADEAERIGLPKKDYIPETIEEKVVTHADNLCNFKRHPVEVTIEKLEGKGKHDAAKRMRMLHDELSGLAGMDLNDI